MSDPRPRPLRPGDPDRLGSYHLTGLLGGTEQEAVYLGRRPGGPLAAIRLRHSRFAGDEQATARFTRAVSAARRVPASCTAPVLDTRTSRYGQYVATEYIRGESVERLVTRKGPLGRAALNRLAIGTAALLTGVHEAGVVLREMAPADVILGPAGPRIVGFRSAVLLEPVAARSGGTPGIGTAPGSAAESGPALDVSAWGALIMFAATGVPHRPGALQTDPAGTLLPERLRSAVATALDERPGRRPTSVSLLRALLAED
ncbi:serine/threonine protein kinase [Actinomadura scrupuli]|uniref:serine/threonine protein kinase n=1 Tax=Actinomadura scrupuli TaxID=559629 RepID=UPI003D96E98B